MVSSSGRLHVAHAVEECLHVGAVDTVLGVGGEDVVGVAGAAHEFARNAGVGFGDADAQLLADGLDGLLDGIAHLLDIRNHAGLDPLRGPGDDAAEDRTSLAVALGDGHHDVRRSQIDCDDVILFLHVCQLCFQRASAGRSVFRLPSGRRRSISCTPLVPCI